MKLEGGNWPTSQSVAMQGDAAVRGPAAVGLGRIWRVVVWEAMVLVVVLTWLVLGIPAQFSASAAPVETVAA